jgi:hypothetical protein
MGPLKDLESPSAVLEHLGHKRHAVELTLTVEGPQYLLFASDFYPVSDV